MDNSTLNYQDIIEEILNEYIDYLGEDEQVEIELICDSNKGHYLITEIGWSNGYRLYGTLIHIDIIDDKLWIQQDGTEEGITEELVKKGISKDRIVLAYKSLQERKITEFAVS
ncbi:XisI protein [Cyanothece sp. BG0011]|uniref:XisI protein n=1 Tax=Cyanothece sp. BG0011 TaxID=2082950 RepID=UPI000D1E284B|nr:XisI protein [Cyanothece sp. BG0011]